MGIANDFLDGLGWVVAGSPVVGVALVVRWRRGGLTWRRAFGLALLGCWILWIVGVTLLDDGFVRDDVGPLAQHVQLRPLETIGLLAGGSQSLRQVVGNAVVFVPLGVLVPMLWPRLRAARLAALAGLGTSLVVEVAQLVLPRIAPVRARTFDVDDLLLNTLGTVVGWVLWWLAVAVVAGWRGRGGGAPNDRAARS